MKISAQHQRELYAAIHDVITDLRIELKLPAKQDVKLAQLEIEIWREQKTILGLKEMES